MVHWVAAQNSLTYVARLSQLETGDEILKGKGDLATLRQVTMGNGSSTWA